MATLQLEQAALLVNRPPEAIERWILDGKVDAERAAGEWLVDSRSLLNAAVSEDVAVHTNGHAQVEPAVAVAPAAPAPEPTAIAVASPEPATQPPSHSDRAIADVATTAIQALNARLEQAISEVERLQDERLKLALQLGYAQSQLRQAQEQLKMLAPPESENPLRRLWHRLTGR